MKSVLQDWVMELPLREQGTLLTGIRGCDITPKFPLDSTERQLVGFIRWCIMNPADPREVDIPGGFFRSNPPDSFKPSTFGHLPLHYVMHLIHVLEVIAYRHPYAFEKNRCLQMYCDFTRSFHLPMESEQQMIERLSEDRIANNSVVS